jgi:hypothetical protein
MNKSIQLNPQQRKNYELRVGIPGATLALINRATGLDILFPTEQDDGKLVVVEDTSLGVVQHTTVYQVTELFYPTPGYEPAYLGGNEYAD